MQGILQEYMGDAHKLVWREDWKSCVGLWHCGSKERDEFEGH